MKTLPLAVVAIAVSCAGTAFAQTNSRLSDKTVMSQFYTDAEMTQMRSDAEFAATLKNLTSDDREAIQNECALMNTQRSNFCDMFTKNNN